MAHPMNTRWLSVKWIMRYLKGIVTPSLLFIPTSIAHPFSLNAYCDADYAADPNDRQSTSGSVVFLGSNLIS